MNIGIITIFPEAITPYANASILGRARKSGRLSISCYNPRDYTKDKHKKVDGRPYGGGPGMVMQAEPILAAVRAARKNMPRAKVIILSPRGAQFTKDRARALARRKNLVLIAGRYEGIDARVKKVLRAEELSIGPYIISGGELPALVVAEAVARHVPGVLGRGESIEEERVAGGEVYTRPPELRWAGRTFRVPKTLISGHHRAIEEYRRRH